MDKDDIKRVEDLLALVESNLRAIRDYVDERLEEVEELEDQIMALVRKE
jgi:archaellum component FlaC